MTNIVVKDSNYEIVKYEPSHFSSFKNLFFKSYKRKKPFAYFKYGLSKTPYGKPIIFLMKYHDKIVGAHSIRPFLLKVKNRNVLGGLTYNTMTHPQHRNKGIFESLAKKTHEEAKKRNYHFVLGFSNANSIHGYKKIGHQELAPINLIQIKKVDFDTKKIPKAHDHRFPKKLGKINEDYKIRKKFQVRIERDDKFVFWRYKKSPEFRYLTCHRKNEFFFIFKKYNDSFHIVDFFGRGLAFQKILLSTALETANELSCKEVTMWIPKKHPIMDLIGKNNLRKLKAKQYFHLIVFNKKLASSMGDINNWYYTMGDSDVF